MADLRVGVFVDWQNCYRSAMDAFPGSCGNVWPGAMARRLAADCVQGRHPGTLTLLHIHSGVPSNERDPVTFGHRLRQHEAWRREEPLTTIRTRTLAYRMEKGVEVKREKGIDVALAIDLVRALVFDRICDIAILVSADQDLLPALELAMEQSGEDAVEVATWVGNPRAPKPLRVSRRYTRQHRMDRVWYDALEDSTDYRLPLQRGRT